MRDTPLKQAADGIPPDRVPVRKLPGGTCMPAVGMGTFGSDKYDGETVAAAVLEAAALGYRHFDCASVYGNEAQIGQALRTIQASGIPREALWITSKVWNDSHGDVIRSCEQSLRDLGLDCLDLYLVHWPFPNFHPKGCSGDYHNPNAKPYLHEAYMRVWAQMETLVRSGKVRAIGTSNMTIPKMELLLRDCAIKPVVNEMELHPHFQQPKLYDFLVANGVQPVGFCPLGSPSRPERDRAPGDTCELEDPVIAAVAERLGVHPAAVCIMWAIRRGAVTIPFAVKRHQLLSNLRAAADAARLTEQDMLDLAAIDKRCRLIKGQVFLWREGLTWEALWDEDGAIAQ
jgi:diketogulonate reductase-like aldo/keto reductase